MDYSCDDISAWPKKEYQVEIRSIGYSAWVGEQFLQILVDKYGDKVMVKQGGDPWMKASEYGFYQRGKKSVAVAEARLRNTFPF